MKIKTHTPREFADALRTLLPPGKAWQWPEGGTGDKLLVGIAQEFARVEQNVQIVVDNAIARHKPKAATWHINDYRRVAEEAIAGTSEAMPRKTFAAGSHAGDRCWSAAGPNTTFAVPLLKVEQLLGPFRVGSHAGDSCWGTRSRYIIRVRYYRSVVDLKPLFDALSAFKQAHVFLWFEDITGAGGTYASY